MKAGGLITALLGLGWMAVVGAAPSLRANRTIQLYEQGEGPRRYRGVNLGGWLVLESWMYWDWWKTTGVPIWNGEWQFCETLGPEKARELLEYHWDTWVTKEDFINLRSAGIEHIRVPIGYWILGGAFIHEGEPYVTGGWAYLERALGWAKEVGLKVIIDLHGAPGVQNGNDNCGYSGGTQSIRWNKPENLKRTNDVLVYLAHNLTALNETDEFAGTIVGLCLLNEPWTTAVGGPITLDEVKAWAQTAVDAVLAAGWQGDIWYPDGFQLTWEGWRDFLKPPQYQNVFIETHIYMLFDPNLGGLDAWGQADKVCNGYYQQNLANADISSGVVVGEWSMDFPRYPNWFPLGDNDRLALQKLFLAQAQIYGYIGPDQPHARGGFFWSFKSKGRVGDDRNNLHDNFHSPWDYLAMWTDGVAPADLNAVTELRCPTNVPWNPAPAQQPVGYNPNLPHPNN